MSRFLTLDQIVSSAYIALGHENDSYKPIFYQWGYDATRSIGLTDTEIVNGEADIVNGAANIPDALIKLINIALLNTSTSAVGYPISDTTFWKNPNVPSRDQVPENSLVFNTQGSQFVFSSAVTENGFNKVLLEYYTLPTSVDGELLIPEYYQEAITAYIEFMTVKRLRHKDRTLVPMSEVQITESRWRTLKGQAISKRNMPSKPEIDGAISNWLSMLPNQSRLQRTSRDRPF